MILHKGVHSFVVCSSQVMNFEGAISKNGFLFGNTIVDLSINILAGVHKP